jgi:hypothetical protein
VLYGRAATAAPQLVKGPVCRHAIHPGGKRTPAVEAGDASSDADHRLLCGVERILIIPEQTAADRVAAVVMAPQKRFERKSITVLCCRDDLGFVVRGGVIGRQI